MLEPVLQKETPEAATLPGIDYRFVDSLNVLSVQHQKAKARTMFLRWAAEENKDLEPFGRYWIARSSTTQEDLLDTEDQKVQKLISQIRSSESIPNNVRLANRLSSLFNAAKEEDPDSPGIPIDSIRTFYYFLEKHSNLKYPIITLTPDNNIYASWEGEQDRLFSVHFLPDENTNFVIFKPNDRHPGQMIRLSGRTTVDTLMKTVVDNGVNEWILE